MLYFIAKNIVKLLHLDLNIAADVTLINKIHPGSARGMAARDDNIVRDCCLYENLPEAQLRYFKMFKLSEADRSNRPHSKPRNILVLENAMNTAEHFLQECVHDFARKKYLENTV